MSPAEQDRQGRGDGEREHPEKRTPNPRRVERRCTGSRLPVRAKGGTPGDRVSRSPGLIREVVSSGRIQPPCDNPGAGPVSRSRLR
jgi:hypothetical protein